MLFRSLLVSEMTGTFSHILGLCIVSIVAYLVAELLNNKPIYHSLLERFLGKDKKEEVVVTGEKTLINFRIPIVGDIIGKSLRDIQWPCKILIVSIEREGHEFIPTGDDTIEASDEISILVDYEKMGIIKDFFTE